MSPIHQGWLLDLDVDPGGGLAIRLIEAGDLPEDESAGPISSAAQRRLRLRQKFPLTFYAAGPHLRLRALWQYLLKQDFLLNMERTERRDLFQPRPLTVMAVTVAEPASLPDLFSQVAAAFPDLTYYDADIAVSLRHAAVYGTFPLCKLRLVVDEKGWVTELKVLDTPWEIDPDPAPLKIMRLEPDCDPRHAEPQTIQVHFDRRAYEFPLAPARSLLVNLSSLLHRYDPDLLLTAWGDTWLLPHLLELAGERGVELPLNRPGAQAVTFKKERSYQAYNQVIYRGKQVLLAGRWHIDIFNAMMFHDYGLEGILESARLTGLPVQQVARSSPGSGISAMQITLALRQGILVPWHKQQAEMPKTALDLIHADQGGLVYQPTPGLHSNVAEVDFVSMYPSIMARFNISPETVGPNIPHAQRVPALNLWVDQETPGLVPQTLRPLLDKRIHLKTLIARLSKWDPRKQIYRARASAQKWLLVTCFGYLGYKNARFGRIEAHQAVTAYSRECLLRAKEAAEDAGFEVHHLYVDGLWLEKPGAQTPAELQPLLDEIVTRTGLPIALDGIYRWVVFLSSRVDPRLPVANRYFGVFQDGSIKVRGIEARRHDTAPFIAKAQLAALEYLAQAASAAELPALLPGAVAVFQRQVRLLREHRLPIQELLVVQTLSRELAEYRMPSPAARAGQQLQQAGKPVRPGQRIKLLFTLGKPGVQAWDCPPAPDIQQINTVYYLKLLLRSAETILQPLGISRPVLHTWLRSGHHDPVVQGELNLKPGKSRSIDSV